MPEFEFTIIREEILMGESRYVVTAKTAREAYLHLARAHRETLETGDTAKPDPAIRSEYPRDPPEWNHVVTLVEADEVSEADEWILDSDGVRMECTSDELDAFEARLQEPWPHELIEVWERYNYDT